MAWWSILLPPLENDTFHSIYEKRVNSDLEKILKI